MRVALVHDWLTGMRGGERLLHQLALWFPGAPLYTLVHVPDSTSPAIEALDIHPSPLSYLPAAARHYRKLLPLFPWAIERFRLEECDLVISTSHAVAKGIQVPRGVPHLCYCMTPMRYIWDQIDAYLGHGARRRLAAPLIGYLRYWDRRTSTPERVTHFTAISKTVAARIREHYGREAGLVYPPVDVARIPLAEKPPEDFYLLVGGFVPYKRERLALEAFAKLGRKLVVAGDGPTRAELAQDAPSNVHFLGRVSDAELVSLYQRARALVYPQEEDFGIIALEAQAAGRPVIAFGRGGATETVVPLHACDGHLPTGIWFDRPDAAALAEAVLNFERHRNDFEPRAIRAHAQRFGLGRFQGELRAEIERVAGRCFDWPEHTD